MNYALHHTLLTLKDSGLKTDTIWYSINGTLSGYCVTHGMPFKYHTKRSLLFKFLWII